MNEEDNILCNTSPVRKIKQLWLWSCNQILQHEILASSYMGNNTKLENRFVLDSSLKSPALSWADIFLSQFILRLEKKHQ